MIDDLYSREILRRTTQLQHVGHLERFDGSADRTAKLCGSQIHVEVTMNGEVVSGFGQVVEACALGQAAAAILSQQVIGARRDELVAARDAMRAMFKGEDYAFPERFADFAVLQSVKDFPARHASTLLALEATVEAMEQVGI